MSISFSYADGFRITVTRETLNDNLIKGQILINGKSIGATYERYNLRISAGFYKGFVRYVSEKHAVGPFGQIGEVGDFLLEIGNVTWSDGRKRTHLLFHGGNKPKFTEGCVMLGAVHRQNGRRYLPEGHTLSKLRLKFYGTNLPTSSPSKKITITVQGFLPSILGKYRLTTNEYVSIIEIKISGNSISSTQTLKFEGEGNSQSMGKVKMISTNEIKIVRSGTVIKLKLKGNKLELKSTQGVVVYDKI